MKYATYYDLNDPENSPLLDAMWRLRHFACQNAEVNPLTKKPGSREAIDAIMSAIDFWAERETGHREYFWGKLPSVG